MVEIIWFKARANRTDDEWTVLCTVDHEIPSIKFGLSDTSEVLKLTPYSEIWSQRNEKLIKKRVTALGSKLKEGNCRQELVLEIMKTDFISDPSLHIINVNSKQLFWVFISLSLMKPKMPSLTKIRVFIIINDDIPSGRVGGWKNKISRNQQQIYRANILDFSLDREFSEGFIILW